MQGKICAINNILKIMLTLKSQRMLGNKEENLHME